MPQTDDTEWAVVALGRLGGLELTVHSDLDLVFIYRGPTNDAARFTRCETRVKRLYQFLEAPTSEGIAYRLDARLRPDGKKGLWRCPLTSSQPISTIGLNAGNAWPGRDTD